MSKENTYPEILLQQMKEYVEAWNKESSKQDIPNVYELSVVDGVKPLKSGGSTIKHYKTMSLTVSTPEGDYLLYTAHAPLKNPTEAIRSKNWLLQLLRDLMYQMFTNYTVVSHAMIIERSKSKEKVKKQIGSLTDLSGKPLTR